jgi:DNA-directed RNA polymerase
MNTHFTTKEVKSPIMTYFYGSRAVPESVFGEGPVLQAFYNILVEEMPGAVEVMEDIQSCWNDQAFAHTWTLPDGHKAIVKVMEPVTKKIEIDELNHRSFSYKTYINKPAQQGISLLANIVQSIDAYIVREMVRRAYHMGYQLVTTHDNFWCHPNYMNETRQNYMDIMVELAHMPLLENILKEVTNNPNLKHTKIDNDLYKHMDGEYAIC